MEQKVLEIRDEESLKIYMDPLRQRIVLKMATLNEPVTAKKLADIMGISPSSAKHHLRKLQSIGVVEVDHTEQIHGITATFYSCAPVEVRIGMEDNTAENEDMKRLLGENIVRMVYKDYYDKMRAYAQKVGWENVYQTKSFVGNMLGGVIYMSPEEVDTLSKKLLEFVQTHTASSGDKIIPIEYSMVAFNAQKDENEKSQHT